MTRIPPSPQERLDPAEAYKTHGETILSLPPTPKTPLALNVSEAQTILTLPTAENTPLPLKTQQAEEQNSRSVPASEKTPPTAKPEQLEEQKTLSVPASEKTPPLAKPEQLEEQKTLVFPPPSRRSLPDKDVPIEAQRTIALPPPPSKRARSHEKARIEAPKTRSAPTAGKSPSPAGAADIEALKTQAVPTVGKMPPSANAADIEALKTQAVPTVGKMPPSINAADIEALKTQAVPTVGKMPPSINAADIEAQTTLSLFEAQKTLPITATEKPARNGQSGAYPRTEVYSDGTFVIYKGAQQAGTTQRNRLTQAPPGAIPSGASVKIPVPPTLARKVRKLAWRFVSPIFTRALDPEPEKPKRSEPQLNPLGWLPVIALVSTLGLFTVATAYNAARDSTPGSELYFWLGLGLVFLPALIRLILPQTSRFERIGLICTVAICLYLTKVTLSPLYFTGYDEFLHWTTVNDIMRTGHLFAKNALLPVSPFYPGLEIVTSALSNLSGLGTFQSGLIVVGMTCLLMVISLFLLCEQLSGSARLASIATIIYMTNPHFLFFDNQFAYESLALPLATFVVFAMTRYETLNNSRRWVMLSAWLVLTAMVLTHHLTNFIFEGIFLLWATVYLFLRPLPLRKSIVIFTVLIGLALTVGTVLLIGNTVIGYFTSFFSDVGGQIAQALGGSSGGDGSRQLFDNAGTQPTPTWERLLLLGSVGLITLSIPFLLLCFWRRYRRNTLVWVFAILVLFYPVLQVLRLTTSGAEASDRASAFVFLAVAFLGAVAIVQFWPVRLLNWKQSTVISATILVLFMGGIILGSGIPPSFMPGPYQVSADSRSIEPEGIQAALWAHTYLGPNNRMYADRINQLLMSSYGEQYLVTKIGDNIEITDVYFSSVVSSYEISLLQKGQVHYLVVDLRMSEGLPQDGFYFEQGEPNAFADTTPMNRQYLTKFDTVPQINRLFDSGDIVIYDTGGLINAPQKP